MQWVSVRWIKHNFVPLMGVLLLIVVVFTYLQFANQQKQLADAVRCQNGLLTLFVARSTAGAEERTALRTLIIGLQNGKDSSDDTNFVGYKYAIDRADQVYANDGKLDSVQQQCAGLK